MGEKDLEPFERFRGKRGLVMGLGVFGGGVESAKFLSRYCDGIVVTDLRGEDVLAESVRQLEGLPIEFRLGEHRKKDFIDADVVIHSPAVRPDNQFLKAARDHGAETTMEMSLFIEACPGMTVGITGSNGKTTTALLAYEMLCEVMERAQPKLEGKWAEPVGATLASPASNRRVWLGGNCGQPLLNRLGEMKTDDVVVLELSSFQLQDWHRIRTSCDVSVITNITPNHLDWHRDMDEYAWAKSAVFAYRKMAVKPAPTLLNADDPNAVNLYPNTDANLYSVEVPVKGQGGAVNAVAVSGVEGKLRTIYLSESRTRSHDAPQLIDELAERADLRLPGKFNWSNAVAAAGAVLCVSPQIAIAVESRIASALRRFRGVEHRLEFCGEVNGARCFNDSIATTPESTLAALSAFDTGIHLLLGGSDKGLSYDALAARIAGHPGIRGIYLQGDNAEAIRSAIAAVQSAAPLQMFGSFDTACDAVFAALEPGDVFLMSPSSASFYEYAPNKRFTNFEHRGRYFKTLVQAHTSETR